MRSWMAEYIWNSPCLKPLIYNPLLVSILILGVIMLLDFVYEKKFKCSRALIPHTLTNYVIVAVLIAMNNIIIKHRYRLERQSIIENNSSRDMKMFAEPEIEIDNVSIVKDPDPALDSDNFLTEYVAPPSSLREEMSS